jgi:hypothetical protein
MNSETAKRSQLDNLAYDDFCNLSEIDRKENTQNKNLQILREILEEAFNVKTFFSIN